MLMANTWQLFALVTHTLPIHYYHAGLVLKKGRFRRNWKLRYFEIRQGSLR